MENQNLAQVKSGLASAISLMAIFLALWNLNYTINKRGIVDTHHGILSVLLIGYLGMIAIACSSIAAFSCTIFALNKYMHENEDQSRVVKAGPQLV